VVLIFYINIYKQGEILLKDIKTKNYVKLESNTGFTERLSITDCALANGAIQFLSISEKYLCCLLSINKLSRKEIEVKMDYCTRNVNKLTKSLTEKNIISEFMGEYRLKPTFIKELKQDHAIPYVYRPCINIGDTIYQISVNPLYSYHKGLRETEPKESQELISYYIKASKQISEIMTEHNLTKDEVCYYFINHFGKDFDKKRITI
jgi:hypothetical protein